MPVLNNPNSNYAKEVAKFEQSGYDPTQHPYPKMLYRAQRDSGGKWVTFEPLPLARHFRDDQDWNRACDEVRAFNRSCQMVVQDEDEARVAKNNGQGWRETQAQAVEFQHSLQKDISTAAAERAASDEKMSPNAQAEAKAHEEETFGHQPEIPEKKRRGRPRKVA